MIQDFFEEMEQQCKEKKCFKCGEQGHKSGVFPKKTQGNETPKASKIEFLKDKENSKGSSLSYAWGKIREHDALTLFDPGSTHKFISIELAIKLGIHDFEMGEVLQANGAFKGQEVLVTPLIGKLRLHIQGYVDKKDIFISPFKHEDVIFGVPWFNCMQPL